MVCIKGVNRSASVAVAPDAPYMAAGTMAEAVICRSAPPPTSRSSSSIQVANFKYIDEAEAVEEEEPQKAAVDNTETNAEKKQVSGKIC